MSYFTHYWIYYEWNTNNLNLRKYCYKVCKLTMDTPQQICYNFVISAIICLKYSSISGNYRFLKVDNQPSISA